MEESKKIIYKIETDHEPGTYDNDMSCLTEDPRLAYKRLQEIKEKYPGKEIEITEVVETTTHTTISESKLEEIANKK